MPMTINDACVSFLHYMEHEAKTSAVVKWLEEGTPKERENKLAEMTMAMCVLLVFSPELTMRVQQVIFGLAVPVRQKAHEWEALRQGADGQVH